MAKRTRNYTSIFAQSQLPEKHFGPAWPTNAAYAMVETSLLFEGAVRGVFSDEKVKSGYRNIIMILFKEDGISQLDIAAAATLKPSTVSIGLKRMEHDGYVTRVNDDKDMRMTRVYLTEKGVELATRAYNAGVAAIENLMKGVTEEENAAVLAIADKMKANFEVNQKTK